MTSRHPAEYAIYPAVGGFGDRVTVAELLKQVGYATGHFGKWHIGPETQPGTYDIDVIDIAGGDRRDERGRDAPIFDAAIGFIEEHRDRPFYMNVWGHITHHAVTPPQSYVDRFRDLIVNQADFPTVMQEKFDTCESRGGDVGECLRNYLAEVSALDDSIGRLLTRLDELGLRDNTIVVFSSDHGSPAIAMTERTNVRRRRRNRQPDSDPERFALTLNLMTTAAVVSQFHVIQTTALTVLQTGS